jgi:putative ABC transport system permease protein
MAAKSRHSAKNFNMFLKMLLSAILRRRSRIIVAVLAIGIGNTVFLGMISIYYDIPLQMGREFRSYGANLIMTPAADSDGISVDSLERFKEILKDFEVVGMAAFRFESSLINSMPVTLAYTDFGEALKTNPYWQISGLLPTNPKEVLVGVDMAEFLGLKIGDTVDIPGMGDNVTATGIVKVGDAEDGFVFLQKEAKSRFSAELVEVSVSGGAAVLSDIISIIGSAMPEISAQPVKRVTQSEASVLSKLQTLVYIVTVVVLILTMICVATTMTTVVLERRKEIGLRKALGAENGAIATEFLGESVIIGLMGGLTGSIFGLVFAHFASMSVFGRSVSIHPQLIVVSILASVLVSMLASILPVRLAINVEPALVLRGE